MKVRFIEVGRDKATFETELPSVTERALTKALRSGARIASRGIEFGLDEDSLASGPVIAGMRIIGRWEVVP